MFERFKHMPFLNGLLRRPPMFYGAARRTIARLQKMDASQRAEFQSARIAKVLSAARKLPGYAGAPATGRLKDWAITGKSAFAGHENDFVASRLLPNVPAATGGTTGQPLKLSRGWQGIAFEQAVIDHICILRGYDPRKARIAILRGDSIKPADDMRPPFWVDEGPARRIFSAHHLNGETICNYKAALRSFQPEILFCYPSSLANLLALIGENSNISIPLVFVSSEMLPPEVNARAQEAFGADVIDFYGHAERIACAYSLNGGGYRFIPSYGHIELVPDGEGLARLVATSLRTDGQIFVRYDTGDLIRVPSHEPKVLRAIALGMSPFQAIEGRENESVILPDGRRIIGLNHIPRGVNNVMSIQLLAKSPGELTIFIAALPAYGEADHEVLLSNIRAKFPQSVATEFRFVSRPVRQRNGKAPLLLRDLDPATLSIVKSPFNTSLEYVA